MLAKRDVAQGYHSQRASRLPKAAERPAQQTEGDHKLWRGLHSGVFMNVRSARSTECTLLCNELTVLLSHMLNVCMLVLPQSEDSNTIGR